MSDEKLTERIERDFTLLMRDHLGGGYVPEFYVNEAGPFAAACEYFVKEAVATALTEERKRIADEIKSIRIGGINTGTRHSVRDFAAAIALGTTRADVQLRAHGV